MNNTRNRVRLTESQLRSVIEESVNQILSELDWKTYDSDSKEKSFFVADEGGYANAFAFDMFDDEGWLEGHENEEGYNIVDFDIIRYCNTWEEACRIADEMNR